MLFRGEEHPFDTNPEILIFDAKLNITQSSRLQWPFQVESIREKAATSARRLQNTAWKAWEEFCVRKATVKGNSYFILSCSFNIGRSCWAFCKLFSFQQTPKSPLLRQLQSLTALTQHLWSLQIAKRWFLSVNRVNLIQSNGDRQRPPLCHVNKVPLPSTSSLLFWVNVNGLTHLQRT